LSQPDMEWEMVSPPAGAYIPSFTIYHLLPDLPEGRCSYARDSDLITVEGRPQWKSTRTKAHTKVMPARITSSADVLSVE
jgi:hypothetical protein